MNALGNPWDITGEDNSGYGKIIATRGSSRWQASEGPEVIYRDGYYYLFLAYGSLSVEYNTRVCRSRNIDGPYVDIHGNSAMGSAQLYPILTAPYRFDNSYGWVGISHCGIFDDGAGNWKNATWTFDAATQTITTSAGVVLYLQREVDWEASPRTHTIVYAAQGNQKTYLGKKLQ